MSVPPMQHRVNSFFHMMQGFDQKKMLAVGQNSQPFACDNGTFRLQHLFVDRSGHEAAWGMGARLATTQPVLGVRHW
eukprot:m.337280 g.337280  ORF g.337280 m.337280 type:complete len:77 (-) comp20548_c0_seq7:76-306(-)